MQPFHSKIIWCEDLPARRWQTRFGLSETVDHVDVVFSWAQRDYSHWTPGSSYREGVSKLSGGIVAMWDRVIWEVCGCVWLCKLQSLSRSDPCLFRRTANRSLFVVCQYHSAVTVVPWLGKSTWPKPRWSKNRVAMGFLDDGAVLNDAKCFHV